MILHGTIRVVVVIAAAPCVCVPIIRCQPGTGRVFLSSALRVFVEEVLGNGIGSLTVRHEVGDGLPQVAVLEQTKTCQ